MTNQEKKKYLEQYKTVCKEADWRMEELWWWQTQKKEDSCVSSEKIHWQQVRDRLESQADKKVEEKYQMRETLEQLINTIEDSRLNQILRFRYLDCLKWEEIAQRMAYDPRWVRRLHVQALDKLKVG